MFVSVLKEGVPFPNQPTNGLGGIVKVVGTYSHVNFPDDSLTLAGRPKVRFIFNSTKVYAY